jgi:hypothetical protein
MMGKFMVDLLDPMSASFKERKARRNILQRLLTENNMLRYHNTREGAEVVVSACAGVVDFPLAVAEVSWL